MRVPCLMLVLICATGWCRAEVPARVLITNDNGIDDPKIVALARAFAEVSETWVVAPMSDRSGSGNYLGQFRQGHIDVRPVDLGKGIEAFAVDGFPGDCVVVALSGLMRDRLPDLVISGINGGENMGEDWMFSGTVGAARVAALAGFPAIAVSGLDDDLPGAVAAATRWVVKLSATEAVRDMAPGDYLTVSLPRRSPDEILGVRWADRAPLGHWFEMVPSEDQPERWSVESRQPLPIRPAVDADRHLVGAGYIAVVPMRADEVDQRALMLNRRHRRPLPDWTGTPLVPRRPD